MPHATTSPQLITVGIIARKLGEPLHRVSHVLRTRQHIRPAARAGTLRLFDRQAVAMIRHEINAIDARRGHGCGRDWTDALGRHADPDRKDSGRGWSGIGLLTSRVLKGAQP